MLGLRPTLRLVLAMVIIAAAAMVLGRVGWIAPVWVALTTLVGLVAVDAWLLLRMPRPTVKVPDFVRAGLRRAVTIPIELGAGVPPRAMAVAVPWQLGGPVAAIHGRAERAFALVPRRRGRYALGPLWTWHATALGLLRRRGVHKVESHIEVGPDLLGPDDDVIGLELHDAGESRARFPGQVGSELRGLRSFVTGDDPRHVDWKASARVGSPMVREWEPDKRRRIMLVVDAGRLMRAEHDGETKLDSAVRAIARVALAAEARDDEVGLLVYADRVLRFVPPQAGAGIGRRLLGYLSDVDAVAVESAPDATVPHLLGLGRRSLVVFITDVLDLGGGDALTRAVAQLRGRHLAVVALLKDPNLTAVLSRAVTSEVEAYERGAAELVEQDRSQALAALSARGVAALDVTMASVASRVVQAYLNARFAAHW